MQINNAYSSSYNKSNNNRNSTENKRQAQPSFGGAGNPLVALANFIENNGFLGEFLTVDAFGMATPRTIQGYNRNKEELGHPNYKAGREELGREVISGPAFFFVPAGVLAIAALLKGKSTKLTVETLDIFKGVMKNTAKDLKDLKNPKDINEKFLENITSNAFEGFEHRKEKITEIKEIFSNVLDKKICKKDAKKAVEEALTTLNKANGKFIDDTSKIKIGKKDLSISDLVSDIPNYLEDFTNKSQKTSESTTDFIEKFHQKTSFVRKTTNIIAVSALSAFLVIIPKLYQTDKKFPGLDGLDTNNHKTKKHKSKEDEQKNNQSVSFSGNHSGNGGKLFNWAAERCSLGNKGDLTRNMFLAISSIFMVGSRFKDSRGNDERREVLTRDIPGVLLSCYGAPILNSAMAYMITKKTGIPIIQFAEKQAQNIKNAKFISQKQVKDLYTKFGELKNPLITFSETVEKHGGDIKKIMNKLGLAGELKAIHGNEGATNKEIIESLKKAQSANSHEFETLERGLTKLTEDNKVFKFAQKAQAGVKIGGILFTAAILGVIIPRLNIVNTKKKYQDKDAEHHHSPQASKT